jgi:signal transduction histidine kinase
MFRSVRFRMAVSHGLLLAVILVVLGGGLQLILARRLGTGATDDLYAAASSQVERIREAGMPVAPADSDVPSAASIQVAVYAAPADTLVGETPEVPVWLRRYPNRVTDLEVAGERVRIVSIPAVVHGSTVAWVSAGRSLAAEDRLLGRVRLLLVLGGILAVVASLGAGWWLAGRAMRPVEAAYVAQAGFAADASHELRTPLTFIRSGVEVLASQDPELGDQVLSEVDYLTGLTQRLLLLVRAERGTVTLDRAPLDVPSACRSAADRSERAHGNRLTLAGEDGVVALADRIGFEAILDALLENVAVHASGEATMSWQRRGQGAVVSIADHGPGIPAEHAGRAFERFFRADPSRARETGGAGLGLALARALAEAQGGRIWIEPTPGGGVTVKLALPAV